MKVETRLIVTALIRVLFLAFAVWMAIGPEALPGAHLITRIGLAAIFFVFAVVIGEVAKLETQFEMLMKALRAATGKTAGGERDAVPILIRALGSREEATREKAHRNLVRMTGQDLPPEKDAWESWWRSQRKG